MFNGIGDDGQLLFAGILAIKYAIHVHDINSCDIWILNNGTKWPTETQNGRSKRYSQ